MTRNTSPTVSVITRDCGSSRLRSAYGGRKTEYGLQYRVRADFYHTFTRSGFARYWDWVFPFGRSLQSERCGASRVVQYSFSPTPRNFGYSGGPRPPYRVSEYLDACRAVGFRGRTVSWFGGQRFEAVGTNGSIESHSRSTLIIDGDSFQD